MLPQLPIPQPLQLPLAGVQAVVVAAAVHLLVLLLVPPSRAVVVVVLTVSPPPTALAPSPEPAPTRACASTNAPGAGRLTSGMEVGM